MRLRSAVGLLLAALVWAAGTRRATAPQPAPRRRRARADATPTPTPTVDPGRLTAAEVAALERADRRLERANRAYHRALIKCGRTATDLPACLAAAYRPYERAFASLLTAIGTARDAAGRQCRALLEDVEPAVRKVQRANDTVQEAYAEQRYDDTADAGGPIADAELAYEGALKNALDSCEDI